MRVGIRRWGAVGRACGERAKSCEWWAGEREREPERGDGKGGEGKGGEGMDRWERRGYREEMGGGGGGMDRWEGQSVAAHTFVQHNREEGTRGAS